MYDNDSKGISYSAGFFMLIAFTIAGFFAYGLLSAALWPLLTGTPATVMVKEISNPAYSQAARILQTTYAFVGFFLPTLVTASLLSRRPFRLLGFSSRVSARQTGWVFLLIAAAIFAGEALTHLNYHLPIPAEWKVKFDQLEKEYNQQTEAIMALKSLGDYSIALVVMGFLPALCEETFFRGGLQNLLFRSTRKPWLAIGITSIIFSLVHFSFYGFLFRVLLGFVLGWIYHYSGRLWLSILGHFLNNALVITLFYVQVQNGKPIQDITDGTQASFWGWALVPLLVFFLAQFRKSGNEVQ